MRGWIVLAALLGFQQAQAATQINVQELNRKLQETHAGWQARETSMSHLSVAEAQRMMGLAKGPNPQVEFLDTTGFTRANLPAVVDWRNKNGVNWVSPILNQANCGSCVAFASIGVLETMVNISSGIPNSHVRLSPQNLFACGGGYCDFGWMPQGAAQYLQKTGVPDEACMPYTSGATGQDVACNASCSDTGSRSVKIAAFTSPTRSLRNVESVKAALQKGPVVTTLTVYADFMNYSSGVYKHTMGDELGGHAISIVGYDDNQRAFIIRNSWGQDWGDHGFGLVSYDDVSGVGDETWAFQMPSVAGTVSVASPIDYAYVSTVLPLDAQSTYAKTDSMTVSVSDENGRAVQTAQCGTSCKERMDVHGLADGKYYIRVQAMDASGKALGASNPHMFFIANQAPALSITYKGKDVDLTQPLKDRVEFNISAHSSTVPMSSLVFHYKGQDGVEHTKTADIVLSEMTMGWRTNLSPNGAYEIWFTGSVTTNTMNTTVESQHMKVTTQN